MYGQKGIDLWIFPSAGRKAPANVIIFFFFIIVILYFLYGNQNLQEAHALSVAVFVSL